MAKRFSSPIKKRIGLESLNDSAQKPAAGNSCRRLSTNTPGIIPNVFAENQHGDVESAKRDGVVILKQCPLFRCRGLI